jgi:hypothetical protein
MKDKDHILHQSIKDLPLYEPDESVLERLEASLFEFPVIDMPVYKPFDKLWGDIEASILKIDKNQKSKWKVLLLVLAVLFALPLGYQFYSLPSNASKPNIIAEQPNLKTNDSPPLGELPGKQPKMDNVLAQPLVLDLPSQRKEAPADFSKIKSSAELNADSHILIENNNKNIASRPNVFSLARVALESPLFYEKPLQQIEFQSKEIKIDDLECSSFTGSTGYFSLGLTAGYEDFIEGDGLDVSTQLTWKSLNASVSYNHKRMYYSVGLGVIFSSDCAKLEHRYLQNQLINSYEMVDSMHYDPITGTTIFYTSTVTVFDSVNHRKELNVKTTYNYLQIPFSIGYKFIKKDHFDMGLTLGVSYLYLLGEHENIPNLQVPNARTLSMEYHQADRRKSFFSFNVQLDTRFRLSRKLNFLVAPSIKFYNNSIYHQESSTKPCSMGINAGIFYHF